MTYFDSKEYIATFGWFCQPGSHIGQADRQMFETPSQLTVWQHFSYLIHTALIMYGTIRSCGLGVRNTGYKHIIAVQSHCQGEALFQLFTSLVLLTGINLRECLKLQKIWSQKNFNAHIVIIVVVNFHENFSFANIFPLKFPGILATSFQHNIIPVYSIWFRTSCFKHPILWSIA